MLLQIEKDPRKFPWEFLSKYRIGVWHSLDKKILKNSGLKKLIMLKKKYF